MLIKSEAPEHKHGAPFTLQDEFRKGMELPTQGHQFINVNVKKSCRPHFGDCFVYEGPVTVLKQVIATTGTKTNQDMILTKKDLPEYHRGRRLCTFIREWLIFLMALTTVISLSLAIWSFYTKIAAEITTEEPITEKPSNQSLICSRSSWGAKRPTGEIGKLITPVPFVMIIQAKSLLCETWDQCTEMIRGFQNWHINNLHLPDISVNFMIGGDGRVYEGRGWNKGGHTLGYNANSVGIMFIGDFGKSDPKPEMVAVTQKLIDLGVQTGKIAQDYKLLFQLQVKDTDSPGARLFESMKKWPHFDGSVHYS